ncbi:LacI family transcriptional regulator [Kushneria sinocarnis]|uniref:LacI family transcriptional regulator n=1 Tax=Kushneria sinocarnis TaxID=595502 RepID=A0A420WTN0_9GAMM|nr:LacI family DNA-binding transcriptional regulator [Kushneria sinocarnis]RKQ96887.1 LacI family transcriptional regulator [Kushneria sinocarnis]
MSTRSRARLEDVASAAGVSRITVSRAFSAPERVHPDTLEHVLRLADQLGYRPSRHHKKHGGASQRVTLGVVNPNMSNPFFSGLTRAITMIGQQHGFEVVMFDSYESEAQEMTAIERMIQMGVSAVIVSVISSNSNYQPKWRQALAEANIPLILVDREIDTAPYAGVYIDNLDCGYKAGAWMARQQPESVLAISGLPGSRVSIGRTSGIREALGEIPLDVRYADFNMELAYHRMRARLGEGPPPSGVIGLNNQITLGIIRACVEAGLRPLQDILLFSIDEVQHADIFGLPIPCLRHDIDEIAYRTVALARQALEMPQAGGSRVVVRSTLKVPETHAPARGAE